MIVESRGRKVPVTPVQLDLGYVALFLGLRINELVASRMIQEGFGDVRESHGYLIQHLIAQERSITELARRMEVTQQAASKAVAELLRLGAVEATSGKDRRSKRIRLSSEGWRCVELARKLRKQLERRLIRTVGSRKHGEAKRILLQCLGELGGMERVRSRRIRPPA